MAIKFSTPAFNNNESIPEKYTCDGDDLSPELHILGIPEEARSLAIVMDDPDAPGGVYTHWIMWDIDPSIEKIDENTAPPGAIQGSSAIEGKNSSGSIGYMGPCPPPGGGPHRYFFKLYVLDDVLGLRPETSKQDLVNALESRLIEKVEIKGMYERE